MQGFASLIVRFRIVTLIVVAVVTVWLGKQAASISVDMDAVNSLPAGDEDVRFFQEIADKYGSNRINMVALEADDVFTHDALSALRAVTKAIESVDGVREVTSLSNLLSMTPEEGMISVRHLIDPQGVPTDPEALRQIKETVLTDPMFVGSLASADGTAALMSVMIEKDADTDRLAEEVRGKALAAAGDYKLYFAGFAMSQQFAGGYAAADMAKIAPLLVILLLVLLWLSLRNLARLVLTLVTAGLALVWTLGALAVADVPMNTLTSVVPLALLAFALLPPLAFFVARSKQAGEQGTQDAAALSDVAPDLLAGLVAAGAGLLALVKNPDPLFEQAGLALFFGVSFSLLLTIVFLPAAAGFLKGRVTPPAWISVDATRFAGPLAGIARFSSKRRVAVLVLAAAVVVAGIVLSRGIPTGVDPMSYFPDDTEPRVAGALVSEKFGGTGLFMVNFAAADIRHPAVLEQMELLASRLRAIDGVHLPQSGADLVQMLNRLINREPGLPDSAMGVTNLWLMLEGQSQVAMMVEPNSRNAIVQARMTSLDPKVTGPAIAEIEKAVRAIQTDLAMIDVDTLSDEQRATVFAIAAGRVANRLVLDLAYHGVAGVDEKRLAKTIEERMGADVVLSATDRIELAARLEKYFAGDAVDVLLPEGFDTAPVSDRLAGLPSFEEAAVHAALKETLPAAVQEEDPDSLEYASISISAIAQNLMREKKLAAAVSDVASLAGIDESKEENAAVLAEVASDVWPVNHRRFAIPADAYKTIVGSDPLEEDRMQFEARLTGWPVVSAQVAANRAGIQVRWSIIVLVLAAGLAALVCRSARTGLAAAATMAVSLAALYGAMGVAGAPIDNHVFAVWAVVLAAGALYAILLSSGYNARARGGTAATESPADARTAGGRSVLLHAFLVVPAFAVLGLSAMTPQRQLGAFIAWGIACAAVAALALTPALAGDKSRRN